MHLADANLLRDLGLRHVAEEPQLDDRAFSFWQFLEQPLENDAMLSEIEALVLCSETALDCKCLAAVSGPRVE